MRNSKSTGSEILYYNALSPMHNATLGSSNAIDLSEYTFGTLVLSAGSVNNFTVTVKRSATSAGTFAEYASANLATGSALFVRSFVLAGSCGWYRLDYSGTGSANVAAVMVVQGARRTPIDNVTNNGASVLSTILS
jgi:hypothetical protein